MTSTPKTGHCHYYRNDYCFICAGSTPVDQRIKITGAIERSYKSNFKIELVQTNFSPGVICKGCKDKLTYNKNERNNFFLKPTKWLKPADDHSDCFFCVEKRLSIIRPVPYSNKANTEIKKKTTARKSISTIKEPTCSKLPIDLKIIKKKGRPKKTNLAIKLKEEMNQLQEMEIDLTNDDNDLNNNPNERSIFESGERIDSTHQLFNPKLADKRSLDEFAINLNLLKRDANSFLIFKYDGNEPIKDNCKIILERLENNFRLQFTERFG